MITDRVEELLPQKFPFVMVDSLIAYNENSLESAYTIPVDAVLVDEGYFSEAGLIEHMAQSVALHTGYTFFLRKERAPKGYIGSINKLTIEELPRAGERICSKVTILQEFMGITLVEIQTFLHDKCIAQGSMKTVLA